MNFQWIIESKFLEYLKNQDKGELDNRKTNLGNLLDVILF